MACRSLPRPGSEMMLQDGENALIADDPKPSPERSRACTPTTLSERSDNSVSPFAIIFRGGSQGHIGTIFAAVKGGGQGTSEQARHERGREGKLGCREPRTCRWHLSCRLRITLWPSAGVEPKQEVGGRSPDRAEVRSPTDSCRTVLIVESRCQFVLLNQLQEVDLDHYALRLVCDDDVGLRRIRG
jgi:hypothetical protein